MELIYFVGSFLWVPVAWKLGNWKHLKSYSSSLYYVMLGSTLGNCLTVNRRLWIYESPTYHVGHTLIELVITFVAFPCVYLVYLSRYPNRKGVMKQFLYISLWVGIFAFCEAVVYYLLGLMSYHKGWNFAWSIVLDYISFVSVKLNQVNTVVAYILFAACTFIFLVLFGFSISDFK